MAEIVYTTPETETRNRARLLTLTLIRETDAAGVLTGAVRVEGVAQVGNWDGATFTEIARVSFGETRTLAQVAAFFGASTLSTMEEKVLERMQTAGDLPAGTIT
jgi:hypothetical protein